MSKTDVNELLPALKAIIARERSEGCPMASDDLIEPALRRWNSYERRFKRHKEKSIEHRTQDLEKGLRDSCPNYSYDPGCIRHLAESFALALFHGSSADSARPTHTGSKGKGLSEQEFWRAVKKRSKDRAAPAGKRAAGSRRVATK